ncbi:MAG: hypothetical protein U0165_04555 [Polyangiaceae bacterium]
MRRHSWAVCALVCLSTTWLGCADGNPAPSDPGGAAGTSGTSGASGSAGSAGSAGAGGTAGTSGCSDSCDDNDVCTVDSCAESVCVHDVINVDDNDACTIDSCDPTSGITHAPVDTDDGDLCTIDSCDSASGVTHDPMTCDDNDACTNDTCDPSTGCAYTPVDVSDADMCTVDSCDSSSGSLSHTPIDTSDGDLCTVDTCDPSSGALTHTAASVDDGDVCTSDACDPSTGTITHNPIVYFSDDFHDNSNGWQLEGGWQIGAATLSTGQSAGYGSDPAIDHSSTSDNGIAGVYIGGNVPKTITSMQYLTSPVIDLSAVSGDVVLDFWRVLNSDYPPYMNAVVEAYNGSSWTSLYSLLGSASQENTAANPGWTHVQYDVSSLKSATFRVRFGYAVGSTSGYTVGGWNIDDLRLVPATSCP